MATSSMDRWMAGMRSGLFGMTLVMAKDHHVERSLALFATIIKSGQLLSMALSSSFHSLAGSQALQTVLHAFVYVSANKFDQTLSPAAFRVLLALACSYVGLFLGSSLVVGVRCAPQGPRALAPRTWRVYEEGWGDSLWPRVRSDGGREERDCGLCGCSARGLGAVGSARPPRTRRAPSEPSHPRAHTRVDGRACP